jgi:hypothetical protein
MRRSQKRRLKFTQRPFFNGNDPCNEAFTSGVFGFGQGTKQGTTFLDSLENGT